MINPLNNFNLLVTGIFVIIGIRTLFWHLQNWQLREYRADRMRAHLQTKEGRKSIFSLWVFKGILPRPKFTGRIFMIIGIFILLYLSIFYSVKSVLFTNSILLTSIIFERSIFLTVSICVFLSKTPVWISREILFAKAKKLRKSAKNLTVIGIAGSYGKSSTKEILVHLLNQEFGTENVLFNPENKNNEVAIARLIIKNKRFFNCSSTEQGVATQKFLVIEVGAYRRGEIAKVCKFIQPQISILTGLNAQHIELFGSQRNIQRAKFEMAENTNKKVFFNRDNKLLSEIFEDRKIKATKIALSQSLAQKIKSFPEKTTFGLYGKNFILPWPGEFFVSNGILALECARECGIKRADLPNYLKTLPPLDRALKIQPFGKGHILWDLYSANPDGVMSAIDHLSQFKGNKIFVGMPLRELGEKAEETHGKIFQALNKIKAQIFWCKTDFAYLGEGICGKKFHQISKSNLSPLKKVLKKIKKDDVILCESKLPKEVLDILK